MHLWWHVTLALILSKFKKYGAEWDNCSFAQLELQCIRKGGQWKDEKGNVCGLGLFYHHKQLQIILDPEKKWHRWNELLLKTFIENRFIGVAGPASSGKSREASDYVRSCYYALPNETTVIITSTERERLEERIWGYIKSGHKKAREIEPSLPGQLLESSQRMLTDERGESEDGRDFRNGMCFPTGTLVDTPKGKTPIDKLCVGDLVNNAVGVGKVLELHTRNTKALVRITLSDGRFIDCTEGHPFLTGRGWIKALALETSDMVLSTHETLRAMQFQTYQKKSQQGMQILLGQMSQCKGMQRMRKSNRNRIPKSKVLLRTLPQVSAAKALRSMRKTVSAVSIAKTLESRFGGEVFWKVLLESVCWKVGRKSQREFSNYQQTVQELRENDEARSFLTRLLLSKMQTQTDNAPVQTVRKGVYLDSRVSSQVPLSFVQRILQEEVDWESKFTEEIKTNTRGNGGVETIPRIYSSLPHKHRGYDEPQPQALVSARHSVSENKTGHRGKWRHSQNSGKGDKGQIQDGTSSIAWVDSVEFLESRSDKRYNESAGGYKVHNLSVDGHPSYSVNGVVVHNCGVPCKKGGNFVGMGAFAGIKNKHVFLVADEGSFLPPIFVDAISNLNKNINFKCIVLANPKDKTDAHGRICEPRSVDGGWDGVDETEITKTWKTRFPDGICVQLVGTDCPNFDVPEDAPVPYPFLITRKAIADDIAFYGRDSAQFSMMNLGMWPKDSSSRRVITRSLCVKHNAFEPVTWKGTKLIDIFGVDAAFGGVGGDRCVGIHIRFGLDVRDVQTVAIEGAPILLKINQKLGPPEDQIVEQTRNECAIRNIPPENVFFDNSGRGSLVTAFHRLWSTSVNGIDFGGKASERMLATDSTKTCREHYEKFVTEIWWSVRHLIEGDQFRNLIEEIMIEGAMREWTLTRAGRIELEPKWKTKERMGRSPDFFDALGVGVEGARQRGLRIARFATAATKKQSADWLNEMMLKRQKFLRREVLA